MAQVKPTHFQFCVSHTKTIQTKPTKKPKSIKCLPKTSNGLKAEFMNLKQNLEFIVDKN